MRLFALELNNDIKGIAQRKQYTYTVTEQGYDKYEPQETRRVTVLAGQTATVSFNNVLRRGDLVVTKTSEDGLVEGVKFHLFGTSLSGIEVNEFAVTGKDGKTLEAELKRNQLDILEKGITGAMPNFNSLMYVVVKKALS